MTLNVSNIAGIRYGTDFEKECYHTMYEAKTDYGGKYLKIRKAVHEAGFDDFCQAGSVNQFHKMNIVAESAILGKRFWFCVDGGYSVKDELHITIRDLKANGPDERIYCKTQEEMADKIRDIRDQIAAAKAGEE